MPSPIQITALGYQEEGKYVIQGLEFDIAIQGNDPLVAKNRFLHSVAANLLEHYASVPETLVLPPAPARFFEMAIHSTEWGPALPVCLQGISIKAFCRRYGLIAQPHVEVRFLEYLGFYNPST